MGQENLENEKISFFKGFQINKAILNLAKDDVIVLHCLPAHLGKEITDDVFYGNHSEVFVQAENRLYTQKALLEMFIK